ncbi:hypothetical protein PR048_009594 [Dryococelus australis]|uniref:Uncharacterized protein n=1 Tax=Dryococelus australis TaxID=614101 RepID=A0ABQ9I0B1_9NEOP|nr:hypothetical protein PR048_009594 [Dryococelus australis]
MPHFKETVLQRIKMNPSTCTSVTVHDMDCGKCSFRTEYINSTSKTYSHLDQLTPSHVCGLHSGLCSSALQNQYSSCVLFTDEACLLEIAISIPTIVSCGQKKSHMQLWPYTTNDA